MKRTLTIFLLICALSALAQVPPPLPTPRVSAAPSTNAPVGTDITLSWATNSEFNVTGYRIYSFGPAGVTNALGVGNITSATIKNLFPPMWFYCTAVNSVGEESTPSNLAGWEGFAEDIKWIAQIAPSPDKPFEDSFVVTNQTSVQSKSNQVLRLRGEVTRRKVTTP